ncbi:MAG TPA: ABC transporter substrate-binding protein, partial [Ardenticatenaceae bacterium]|nr:ABC transporter substrate-binding protein [Ardenticatenaceae bacterium]
MRKHLLIVMLLLAAMVLASCQTGQQAPATQPPAEQPADTPAEATEAPAEATEAPAEATEAPAEATEAPAEATEPAEDTGAAGQAPEDELGVVEIAPGDPIVLAYALVVAGADATLGEDSRRGVEIALADAGNELLGHPIELIGEDTGCNAEGGQAAATRLVANEQIVAIIGTSCSSEARVAAPVVDQAGMVLISPSNTAPDLTDPETHVPGYLRTAHNDEVQGRVVAEFAYNELGLTRAATIHDGSPYAEGLVTVFADVFTELGGEMVSEEAVGPEDTDMRPVLTRVAAQEPELIYYPIFIQAGGFVTRQAREVEGLEEVVLMGSDGLFSPEFLNAAGDAVEGMYLSSPDFSAFQEGYEEFLAKHEERYGEATLSAFHAHAYDATNMILAAIEQVAVEGEDGTLWIGRQALRDALYATEDFQGLTGNLTCDENGDCADPVIAVYEVVDADPDAWTGGTGDNPTPQKVYPEAGAAEGEGEAEETPEAEAEETPEADAGGEAATGDTIVMSFVPSGDTQEIIASGEEIAAMIEDITGLDIEANVATSYAAVVEA